MERYRLIEVDTTESTNTYARNMPAVADDTTPAVVITDKQTAGRGQRGNSWESEPGRNLTFSLVVYPRWLAPAHQFELSMLVSIGLINGLRSFVNEPERMKIKWPNDIYYDDRKLAGILIENTLGQSCIERSIIGIGINVNQTEFVNDAPNPISLVHTTGSEADRRAVLSSVVNNILDMIEQYADDPEVDELTYLYNNLLWRKDGATHRWHDTATDTDFDAVIEGVESDGRLTLRDADGQARSYLFKEVSAVL